MRVWILLLSLICVGCDAMPVRRPAASARPEWRPKKWLPAAADPAGAEAPAEEVALREAPPDDPYILAGRRIVVDAGHGGKDPGAIGITGLRESEFNLDLAMRLARSLLDRGAEVVVTRNRDTFLSLDLRARIADYERCDVFISIHADSALNRSARGPTVYIAEGASPISRRVGKAIDRAWQRQGLSTRGVREKGFRVLVGHTRPAVLLECGYLSNRQDEALLRTDAHREMLVARITEGLVAAL